MLVIAADRPALWSCTGRWIGMPLRGPRAILRRERIFFIFFLANSANPVTETKTNFHSGAACAKGQPEAERESERERETEREGGKI